MYSVQLYKLQSNWDGLLNKTPNFSLANSGADPGFYLGGGALVYFNTNKPHSFFAEYQLY